MNSNTLPSDLSSILNERVPFLQKSASSALKISSPKNRISLTKEVAFCCGKRREGVGRRREGTRGNQ